MNSKDLVPITEKDFENCLKIFLSSNLAFISCSILRFFIGIIYLFFKGLVKVLFQ